MRPSASIFSSQSGDIQQLPDAADVDFESVEELEEEGKRSKPRFWKGWRTLKNPL
jgi:hypothetical protein